MLHRRGAETESSEHMAAVSYSLGGIRGLGNGLAEGRTCPLLLCDQSIPPFHLHQRRLPFPWPQRYRKGPGHVLEDPSQGLGSDRSCFLVLTLCSSATQKCRSTDTGLGCQHLSHILMEALALILKQDFQQVCIPADVHRLL